MTTGDHGNAIQQSARSYPLRPRLWPFQHACRVGQRTGAGQLRDNLLESLHLDPGLLIFGNIGIGEVRHQSDVRIDVLQGVQAPIGLRRVGRSKSEAMHSGIDLQPDLERARIGIGSEPLDLAGMVHHRLQPEAVHFRNVRGFIDARKHHDALPDAGGTQALAIGNAGHAEGIGPVEHACDPFKPMPVAIGLDHCHHLRRTRQLAQAFEIRTQGAQMNRGAGRPAHSNWSV
jgi:hypothetical protein